MKKEYPPLSQLKAEYGRNKQIPENYQEVVLRSLFHFPQLRETTIDFIVTDNHEKRHSTEPSFGSVLKGKKRSYTVRILEKKEGPEESALIKNLPYEAQMAAIAHELAHIVQFEKGSSRHLKITLNKLDKRRERERQADILVIEHGLGFELYTYATYVRNIKGLIDENRDLDVNHLHPNEILEALPPDQLQEVHRF